MTTPGRKRNEWNESLEGQSPLSSSFSDFRGEGKKNISQADLQQHLAKKITSGQFFVLNHSFY